MGILSCTLNSAAATGGLRYDPKCRRVSLAHLCSADDLMVFTNGPLEDLQAINSILKDAHHLSGLKCDPAKSELYHAGVSDDLAERLKEESGFKVGQLPVKYLGVLLISGKLDYNDCRIHHWASKSLSFAGTLQHISSVIFSIANYWCNYLYSEVILNDQWIWPYARSWLIFKLLSVVLSLHLHLVKIMWFGKLTPDGIFSRRSMWDFNRIKEALMIMWVITPEAKKKL